MCAHAHVHVADICIYSHRATPRANYPNTEIATVARKAKLYTTCNARSSRQATPHKPSAIPSTSGKHHKKKRGWRQNQKKLRCTVYTSAYIYNTNIIHNIQSRCAPCCPASVATLSKAVPSSIFVPAFLFCWRLVFASHFARQPRTPELCKSKTLIVYVFQCAVINW